MTSAFQPCIDLSRPHSVLLSPVHHEQHADGGSGSCISSNSHYNGQQSVKKFHSAPILPAVLHYDLLESVDEPNESQKSIRSRDEENWPSAYKETQSNHYTSVEDDQQTVDSLHRSLWNNDTTSHRSYPASTNATDALSFTRRRKFYGREWVFAKILKYLRCSLRDERLGTFLDNGDKASFSEALTAISDTDVSGRIAPSGGMIARNIVIVGGPGSGKTTICRRIVDAFRRLHSSQPPTETEAIGSSCVQVAEHLLCIHFCSIQLADTLDPHNFVQSVHRQLVSENCPLREAYLQALGDNNAECGTWLQCGRILTSTSEAFRHGVLTALRKISSFTPTSSVYKYSDSENTLCRTTDRVLPYLLIVDGLDESEFHRHFDPRDSASQDRTISTSSDYPNTSPSLMEQSLTSIKHNHSISELLVDNLEHFPSWMSLLLTCRRQHRNTISRLFPGIRRISIDDLHRPCVVHDVQQYILSRLSDERSLQHALRVHMHSDVLGLLRIKSSACLLYLETLLDGIADEWIAPDELAAVPGTLNGLYLWLCQRMCGAHGGKSSTASFAKVRPLLEVILSSNRSISEEGLYKILSFSYPDLDEFTFHDRLSVLSRVLIAVCPEEEREEFFMHYLGDFEGEKESQSGKKIHLFHPSFAEWLLDVKHCTHTFLCDKSRGAQLIERYLTGTALHDPLPTQSEDEAYQESTHDTTIALSGHPSSQYPIQDRQELELTQLKSLQPTQPEALDSSFCYYYTNHTTSDILKPEPTECALNNKRIKSSPESHSIVFAARRGEFARVDSLLKAGADPNQMDEDGWSALRTAAWRGHSDIVELLLCHGASVNLSGPDGRSALRAAAWAGHEEIVQRLIDAGADVDIQDAEGRSPLIAAAYMGHVGVVELLSQAGANLDHADEDGRTALHVATFCVRPSTTHLEVVSCLLEYGANPNLFDSEGLNPLLGAARVGNHAVCELCLEADTDVNQTDKCGNTALSLAVLGGHIDVVRLLLFWGATVDVMDPGGRSLLSLASATGNPLIVQELLARGLDEAHRDHSGCTPLHLAAAGPSSASVVGYEHEVPVEQYCSVVKILLDSGAHLEDTDNSGRTALLIACENGQVEVAKLLITYSANASTTCSSPSQSEPPASVALPDHIGLQALGSLGSNHPPVTGGGGIVNQPSLDHETPLRAAALANNIDLVSLLLSVGADPDYQDSYGRTVLYMLALEGVLEVADLILRTPSPGKAHFPTGPATMLGANPVLADDEGRCPLHVATWQGHLAMVRLLLQAGTPVDIRDREGRTPLHLAAWQGHVSVCHALLNEANARVDAACCQGATALCIAAQEGHLEVCTILLNAGANPYQADSHGRTPYCVALKANHFEICGLLETAYGIGLSTRLACSAANATFDSHAVVSTQPHLDSTGVEKVGGALGRYSTSADASVESRLIVPSCSTPICVSCTKVERFAYTPPTKFDDANSYAKPPGPVALRHPMYPTAEMYQQNVIQPLIPNHGRISSRKHSERCAPASAPTSESESHSKPPSQSSHWAIDMVHSNDKRRYAGCSRVQPPSQLAINPHGLVYLSPISEAMSSEVGQMCYLPLAVSSTPKMCTSSGLHSPPRAAAPVNHIQMGVGYWGAGHLSQPGYTQAYHATVQDSDYQHHGYGVSVRSQVQRNAFNSTPTTQFTQANKTPQLYAPYDCPPQDSLQSALYMGRVSHPLQPQGSSNDAKYVRLRKSQQKQAETHPARYQGKTVGTHTGASPTPMLFPEHCVISPTKRRDKSGPPISISPSELSKQPEESMKLRGSCASDSPRQVPPMESRGVSAKAALAGMFGLGARRSKKIDKKNQLSNASGCSSVRPFQSQHLIPFKISSSCAHTGDVPRQANHPRALVPQQRPNWLGNEGQLLTPGAMHARDGQDSSRTSNSSIAISESDRSASGSVQFEAIARRLACCSIMEELPPPSKTNNVPCVGKSPQRAVKPCSPQTWTNQNSSKEKHCSH
ncbi:unnamed protein product [Dicrocoelium dendriticum]|nr:unnamed protein product [Dicrocoelium dendriticum]